MESARLALYRKIYTCMHCQAAVEEKGVRPFVLPGPNQTIPVSHFGRIDSARIWLIGTNPKGNRKDSNVGFLPSGFNDRTQLTDAQIEEIFQHFSDYFDRSDPDSFFDLWIDILDGLDFRKKPQTWRGGDICCVDLIKCPTVDNWGKIVCSRDKKLIYGCFKTQRFLAEQIAHHRPTVLIFSAGLGRVSYHSENSAQNQDVALQKLWPNTIKNTCTGIWSFRFPARLSIGLASKKDVNPVKAQVREAIQTIVREWDGRSQSGDGE